jgi:hypothetical protein
MCIIVMRASMTYALKAYFAEGSATSIFAAYVQQHLAKGARLTIKHRQEFLESTWPAYHAAPTAEAVASASKGDDKELEKEEQEGKLVEPKLNLRNTAMKMLLDQTVGAAFNTVVFSLFIHGVQQAMPRPLGAPLSTPDQSVNYLLALATGAVKTSPVNWDSIQAKIAAEFWPMIFAGLKLWPLVSFINFAFVKSITGRNLLGSLAGVGWNIYLSLVAGQ